MQNELIKVLKKIPFLKEIKFFVRRLLKPKLLYFFSGSVKPISTIYGIERGVPIDRFYIERFLTENKKYIKGHCLELLENNYTIKYGGNNILKSDILDLDLNNKRANIFGDLKNLKNIINDNSYDCVILTQVLQFIDNCQEAISECYRILKPGGALLITVPCLGRMDCASGVEGDFWRFTSASINYLLKDKFDKTMVSSVGNVKTGISFWIGLSQQDIKKSSYNYNDENFPMLVTAVAIK